MTKPKAPMREKRVPTCVFPLPFHDIFGDHSEKDRKAKEHLQKGNDSTVQKKIAQGKKQPKISKVAIQRVVSVSSVKESLQALTQAIEKAHLRFLLEPETMARRRKNCVKDTAKAAT